jgi:hypothetical protein
MRLMQGQSDVSQPTQQREERDESLLDLISDYGHKALEKNDSKNAPESAATTGNAKDGKK